MRRACCVVMLLAAAASGCGSKFYKPKGRVLKNGVPFVVPPEDKFVIMFVPVVDKPVEQYPAVFNRDDGTFSVTSRNMKGMPAGKYRVFFTYRAAAGSKPPLSDELLDSDGSSFVFDVDANTKEIVIDLDQPAKGS